MKIQNRKYLHYFSIYYGLAYSFLSLEAIYLPFLPMDTRENSKYSTFLKNFKRQKQQQQQQLASRPCLEANQKFSSQKWKGVNLIQNDNQQLSGFQNWKLKYIIERVQYFKSSFSISLYILPYTVGIWIANIPEANLSE